MRYSILRVLSFVAAIGAHLAIGVPVALAGSEGCANKVAQNAFEEDFSDTSCILTSSVIDVSFASGSVSPNGLRLGEPQADPSSKALLLFEDESPQSGGSVINSASSLEPGKISSGISSTVGVKGSAFDFTAAGGVSFPNSFTTVQEVENRGISFSAWIKPREVTQQSLILGSSLGGYSNPGFYVRSGKLAVYYSNTGPYYPVEGTTTLSTDQWYHVAESYDPDTHEIRVYLNGELEKSYTISGTLSASSNPVYQVVGGKVFGAGYNFNGAIDEAWLRMRPMHQTEASDIFNRRNVSGSFESEWISIGDAFNTLTMNVDESNSRTTQVWVDTGTGWREMPYNSSLTYASPSNPNFNRFRYKVAFPAATNLNSIRFTWSNQTYPATASSISFLTVTDTYSGHESSLKLTVKDGFARKSDINLILSTGDFENFPLIDGYFQAELKSLFPYPAAVPWASTTSNHIIEGQARVDYIVNLLNPQLRDRLYGMSTYRAGPVRPGRDNTTFSFDLGNAHFVLLDQYLESVTGVANPRACVFEETLTWLEQDLHQNAKPFIFIFGHEGAFPISEAPYNNHYGDSLDDVNCPGNYLSSQPNLRPMRDKFWALLRKYNVTAHFVGHSHAASVQIIKDLNSVTRVNGGESLNPSNGVLEVDDGYGSLSGEYHMVTVYDDHVHFDRYSGNGQEGGFTLEAAWDFSTPQACGSSPRTLYVDKNLSATCNGNYSVANRDCAGSDGIAYRTIDEAARQALAGDTVLIRNGTYKQTLRAWNSGVTSCPITFKRYGEEDVLITDTPGMSELPEGEDSDVEGSDFCIYVYDKTNIEINGIRCEGVSRWARIINSRDITIQNSTFRGATCPGAQGSINILNSSFCTIRGNTLDDANDNIYMAHSDNSLIEGNTITKGRHVLWAIKCGNRNVVRGNYFNNPIQKIGEIYDCENDPPYVYDATKYNLVESNTFAYTPPVGANGPYNGIQFAGQKTIIRKNVFYENTGGGLALALYDDEARYTTDNRIYNNVFYKNHFGGISISDSSDNSLNGNVLKNNILYQNDFMDYDYRFHSWGALSGMPVQVLTKRTSGYVMQGNVLFNSEAGEDYLISGTYYDDDYTAAPQHHQLEWWEVNYPLLWSDNIEAEPAFKDVEGRDFHLADQSPVIDRGNFLTKSTGSGEGTKLYVEDPLYFYPGNGIEGEEGDEIQLEGQNDTAGIVAINYSSGELTLDKALTWSAGQEVALPFHGAAPDPGAFEYIHPCMNGQKDADEEGVDCGGNCPQACQSSSSSSSTSSSNSSTSSDGSSSSAESCHESNLGDLGRSAYRGAVKLVDLTLRNARGGALARLRRALTVDRKTLGRTVAALSGNVTTCGERTICNVPGLPNQVKKVQSLLSRLSKNSQKVALARKNSKMRNDLKKKWKPVIGRLAPYEKLKC